MQYVIAIIFLLIFIQDIKHRGVHWVLFPILLVGCIYYSFENISINQVVYNFSFLVVLLSSLTIYLSIKERRIINISKGYFSWGDILFLVVIIPLFSFQMYMLFFIVGTILSLIFHLIASMISIQKTLPYAGYMSILGIVYLVFENRIQQITNYL